ncbi:MAG: amidohydrolase family protein [Caldisericaceae bacterium]
MKYVAKGIWVDGKILEDYGFECSETFQKFLPIEELKGSSDVISLDGFVYPAFIESHAHIKELSNVLSYIDGSSKTFKEIKEIIFKSTGPVYIFNVDFNNLQESNFRDLFYYDKDVYIQSKDEHSVFVSKKFLEDSKVSIDQIPKDSLGFFKNEFLGIFKDYGIEAVKHLKRVVFTKEHLKKVEEYFLSRGIVSITNFDFDVHSVLKNNPSRLRVLQGIAKDYLKDFMQEGIKTYDGDNNFKWGPLKVFLDGSLGSQTMAMVDNKPFKGLLLMDFEELEEIVHKANEHGISVAAHAIGSKAVHIAISVYNRIKHSGILNRIEHLQFIDENDIVLLKETPFIPSMQPLHAVSDEGLYKKFMGNYKLAYAWKTVVSLKDFAIFGSDVPVEDASIFKGLFASINRSFLKEESIPLSVAINAYTEWAGLYNFLDKRGKIKEGYLSDFVVLKYPIKEDNLLTNEVMLTAKGGEVVWEK